MKSPSMGLSTTVHEEMDGASWAEKEGLLVLEVVLAAVEIGLLIQIGLVVMDLGWRKSTGEPISTGTSVQTSMSNGIPGGLYRRRENVVGECVQPIFIIIFNYIWVCTQLFIFIV
jgi:hypothetical protein